VSDKNYPAPWDFIAALFPHVPRLTRASHDRLSTLLVRRMDPAPVIEFSERIPSSPRFVLAANHHQRSGLWIAYPAAAIMRALFAKFGEREPIIRWIVTANWPPWRIGPLRIPSPGDVLLPRVAHAVWSYDVPFAGSNPARAAASIRQLLRDARTASQPFGIFPEGVAGTAGRIGPPLPGTDRLISMLAKQGFPVVPVRIYETDRVIIRFGDSIPPNELLSAANPAELAMTRIRELLP
jgi:1-acyl-sn-glycerol-3-phosphate acyltransferase